MKSAPSKDYQPDLAFKCNYIIVTLERNTAGTNMTQIVKIGNSQGIRIPKPLIEQAELEGKELKLQIVKNGLLITPALNARDGWAASIEQSIADKGNEPTDHEWLDPPLDSDSDLEW